MNKQEYIPINPFETDAPSSNVSDKYSFVSTKRFINDVERFGYKLESTSQARRGLGLHSMSFSHAGLPQMDGLNMRLLATNSHNGSSAFRLYVSILVQVCSNGLVAWRPEGTNARVVHRGYALNNVNIALDSVRERFDGAAATVRRLQSTPASPEATAAFLLEAAKLRDAQPYRISDLVVARHSEQANNSAWNVFNRTQEALVKGGYRTVSDVPRSDGTGFYPGSKARELKAVKDTLKINTELWKLALSKLLGEQA